MAYLAFWFVLGVIIGVAHAEPRASLPYRNTVIREARFAYGLDAPVAMFAGQIEQESAWRPKVCSAYACGLTQFTPATARDIDARHNMGGADVLNPSWAIRALMFYDHDLYNSLTAAENCDRWAFTLSAYNGGMGNLLKDKALCARANGCNPNRWWRHVELHSGRRADFFRENRGYPEAILHKRQFGYAGWGRTISCPSS